MRSLPDLQSLAIWLVLPLVGAAIGWITNLLAVKMLFRPRSPWRIAGFTVQGLVPKRRHELAVSIADTIETHFLSSEELKAAITSPEFIQRLRDRAAERFTPGLAEKVHALHPMAAMVVTPAMIEKLKEPILDRLFSALPGVLEESGEGLVTGIDLRQRILAKIEAFEAEKLEALVLQVARKELVAIEYLGGVLGFLIGVGQAAAVTLLAG